MAARAVSPPFSTIEISRATDARSPARAPTTSTSGSYVLAKRSAPRPATFAAFTPARDAAGCVLLLDVVPATPRRASLPATPLTRREHHQRHRPEHGFFGSW